jgi:hypothetical protein
MAARAVPSPNAPLGDAARFLSLLSQPGDVREVRIPKHNRFRHTAAGWFDSPEALLAAVARWDGQANIYLTLNPVNPALRGLAHNRTKDPIDSATADTDILRRSFLVLDIDPDRHAGISSTDEELAAAQAVCAAVVAWLREQGWPEPIVAMSGNGCYALYAIDLPNHDNALALVEAVLKALAARFDTPAAHFDQTVGNASRIIGLVGTKKVKGDPLPDRPHRRSQLESVPETLVVVSHDQLAAVAAGGAPAALPPPSQPTSPTGGARLVELLTAHGIACREQPPDAAGVTWYHLEQCPFHDDGRPFECGVGQKLPDGAFAGHCFHPEGKDKSWHDFKLALGLGAAHRANGARLQPLGDLDAARATVRAALAQVAQDAGVVFMPETLGALALLRAEDRSEFARVRQTLMRHRVSWRDGEFALKAQRPRLRLLSPDAAPPDRSIGSMLPDAPVPTLLVPDGYVLSETLTALTHDEPAGPTSDEVVAFAPVVISGRLQDVDDGSEFLRLAWRRPSGWRDAVVDRGTALEARLLTPLASSGFPVASDTAHELVSYLHRFEALNYAALPSARVSAHLGWQGPWGELGFLWGRSLIQADGVSVADVGTGGAPADTWQEDWVASTAPPPATSRSPTPTTAPARSPTGWRRWRQSPATRRPWSGSTPPSCHRC